MSALKRANFENEKTSDKVAYLYFTHGTLLQEFSAINEKDCKQEWAKYCSISALEVGLNKLGTEVEKELVLDLHNDNQYSLETDHQSQLMAQIKQEFVVEQVKDLIGLEWNLVDDHQDLEF